MGPRKHTPSKRSGEATPVTPLANEDKAHAVQRPSQTKSDGEKISGLAAIGDGEFLVHYETILRETAGGTNTQQPTAQTTSNGSFFPNNLSDAEGPDATTEEGAAYLRIPHFETGKLWENISQHAMEPPAVPASDWYTQSGNMPFNMVDAQNIQSAQPTSAWHQSNGKTAIRRTPAGVMIVDRRRLASKSLQTLQKLMQTINEQANRQA